MSFANFIPTVWSEAIQRELERKRVYVEDCNRSFEGEIKTKGDTVRILGVGKPTIKSILRKNANNEIDGPEEVEDTSVSLTVDQIRYFNYMVGDIDKAQAVGGVMEALNKESAEGLANEEDTYVSGLIVRPEVKKLHTAPLKVVTGTAGEGEVNVLYVIDNALECLYEQDVNPNSTIVLTVSPRFYTRFKQAYVDKDTDNSEIMKNGRVARYGNAIIKMSNNVTRSADGGVDNLMIRTQRAIAFANAIAHIEPYRPEKRFADAVKGYELFGAKIVRPKELLNVNVTY